MAWKTLFCLVSTLAHLCFVKNNILTLLGSNHIRPTHTQAPFERRRREKRAPRVFQRRYQNTLRAQAASEAISAAIDKSIFILRRKHWDKGARRGSA